MGNLWPKKRTLLIAGLDGAGKSTVLYRLLRGETLPGEATLGYNAETLTNAPGWRLRVFDAGGAATLRHTWPALAARADLLVFVVDSADGARMTEARAAFWGLLARRPDLPVLLLCNQQDRPGAMGPGETIAAFGLHSVRSTGLRWRAQGTVATTGQGLEAAVDTIVRLLE